MIRTDRMSELGGDGSRGAHTEERGFSFGQAVQLRQRQGLVAMRSISIEDAHTNGNSGCNKRVILHETGTQSSCIF